MTNEEFERTKEFILNQQAQFDANIQKLEERQAQLQEAQAQLQEAQAKLQEGHARLQGAQVQTELALGRLADLTTAGFSFVIENAKNVNSKLDALIDTQTTLLTAFSHHLREDHNGIL